VTPSLGCGGPLVSRGTGWGIVQHIVGSPKDSLQPLINSNGGSMAWVRIWSIYVKCVYKGFPFLGEPVPILLLFDEPAFTHFSISCADISSCRSASSCNFPFWFFVTVKKLISCLPRHRNRFRDRVSSQWDHLLRRGHALLPIYPQGVHGILAGSFEGKPGVDPSASGGFGQFKFSSVIRRHYLLFM